MASRRAGVCLYVTHHCLTANKSTHTRDFGKSLSAAAATRVPKRAPQQCERKTSAGPTLAAPRTPGRSTYRHRVSEVARMAAVGGSVGCTEGQVPLLSLYPIKASVPFRVARVKEDSD